MRNVSFSSVFVTNILGIPALGFDSEDLFGDQMDVNRETTTSATGGPDHSTPADRLAQGTRVSNKLRANSSFLPTQTCACTRTLLSG